MIPLTYVTVTGKHGFLYLLALSELRQERGRHSCSSNWYLLIKRWLSTRAWLYALERTKKSKYISFPQLTGGSKMSYEQWGTVFAPKGRILSSESVSLSVLSSTRKSGQFQDMLTIPSDSCNRTWASIRPWQSITITWPSAVPNKTWGGIVH